MSTPRGPNMEKLPDNPRGLGARHFPTAHTGPSTAAGLTRGNVNAEHSIQKPTINKIADYGFRSQSSGVEFFNCTERTQARQRKTKKKERNSKSYKIVLQMVNLGSSTRHGPHMDKLSDGLRGRECTAHA